MDDSSLRLWWALREQTGRLDADSQALLILGLLVVRLSRISLWEQLARSRDGRGVVSLLGSAKPALGHHEGFLPLVQDMVWNESGGKELVELVRLIGSVDVGPSDSSHAGAALFDSMLARFYGTATGRIHLTPQSIVECLVGILDPQPGHSVYDPCCGFGELLVAAAARGAPPSAEAAARSFIGQPLSEHSRRWTLLNGAAHGVKLDVGGRPAIALLDDQFADQRFDRVLVNPPFNMSDLGKRWPRDSSRWHYGEPPSYNANFGWLQHVASKLAAGGRAAVVMSNSTTTSEKGAESTIRSRMIDAGIVECVVALPEQLFYSTGIPVSIWILRTAEDVHDPKILFVDATSLGSVVDRGKRVLSAEDIGRIVSEYWYWRDSMPQGNYEPTVGFARAVDHSEVYQHSGVLNPRIYVQSPTPEIDPERSLEIVAELHSDLDQLNGQFVALRARLDGRLRDVAAMRSFDSTATKSRAAALAETCDVLAGPGMLKRGEPQSSWVPVILPRNIKHNSISGYELDAVEPRSAAKLTRYRLVEGDIVCIRTGELGRYGLVGPEQTQWLLGPGCMRIRPGEGIDSRYLICFLTSGFARDWLARNAAGSAIKNISTKTLGRMPLDLPQLELQRELGAMFGELDAVLAVQDRISATVTEIREALLQVMIRGGPLASG